MHRTIGNRAVTRLFQTETADRHSTPIPPAYEMPAAPRSADAFAIRFSKAPQPSPPKGAAHTAPARPQPGVADLYITVRAPSQFTEEELFTLHPLEGPSSGISFQFARPATFFQDEHVLGVLRWKSAGSKAPGAFSGEEAVPYKNHWSGQTVERTDLPGHPFLLDQSDTHLYGLASLPGRACEEAAKKNDRPFDRTKDDWDFEEHGKFIDTVTFSDKEIKRVYYYDFQCLKRGSKINAKVDYSNVDRIERV
ncbi:MAG: hypothetical protein HY282_05965 [Nitrospirae bacterium]|nr:hypothetical protein [Candidatus Manganitrophaceae bacterium]